jgi:hypothetical protein
MSGDDWIKSAKQDLRQFFANASRDEIAEIFKFVDGFTDKDEEGYTLVTGKDRVIYDLEHLCAEQADRIRELEELVEEFLSRPSDDPLSAYEEDGHLLTPLEHLRRRAKALAGRRENMEERREPE